MILNQPLPNHEPGIEHYPPRLRLCAVDILTIHAGVDVKAAVSESLLAISSRWRTCSMRLFIIICFVSY